jgi:hypothetical protein
VQRRSRAEIQRPTKGQPVSGFPAWASSNAEQSLPRCELTDLPRLMCSCAEHDGWAFDFDDLEPSEHAMFAADPEAPAVAPRLTPRAIPEYQAEPWCEARNVPLVTTGSTCEVCNRHPAGDAFVCPECLDDLRVHLGDVPGLLDDLDVMGSRQARVTSRSRATKPSEHTRWDHVLRIDYDSPIPVRTEDGYRDRHAVPEDQGRILAAKGYNHPLHVERAVSARDEIGNEVTGAVRAVTEARGLSVPSMDTREASRWLLSHLSSVSLDPHAPDICNGLRKTTKLAKDIIDNVDEGVYIGICDDENCRARMFADPELPEHRCTTCGETYDVGARREAIRERVLDRLLTTDEIVGLSKADHRTFGSRVTLGQLEHWIASARLLRVGTTDGDEPSYRAGDVADLVSALIESRHDVVSLAEAANLLGIPVKTLYRWDSAGLLSSTNPERKRGKTFDLASVRAVAQVQQRA